MSVKRFDLVIHCPLDRGNDWHEHEVEEDDTVRDGRYVLHADHLLAVAEARRAAFMECLEQYEKITRGNPLTFLTFSDWLKARAEGE